MRALVTGVGGFVGRHLVRHLLAAGDEARGLARPDAVPAGVGVPVDPVDLRDTEAVARSLREAGPDAVYHLAGLTHVGTSYEQRRQTLETNVIGALAVLEASRLAPRPPRVLLVGSAYEYGRVEGGGPIDEATPLRPVSPYGLSKVAQEMLGREYAARGLEVLLARAFNHTGPGQDPSFVVSDWSRRIAEIEAGRRPPLLAVGDLDVERDFTDVRDVVVAYRLLVEKGRPGEPYNVCSGVARPLGEVLEALRLLSRVPFTVEATRSARPAEVRSFVGSREKARAELGWEPRIPFEETLLAVLEHWRKRV